MTWYKLCDSFSMDRRVEALEAKGWRVHSKALALWVLGASDCARRETDGVITLRRIQRLVPWNPQGAIEALVDVGLWGPQPPSYDPSYDPPYDPPSAWVYVGWTDHQPTAEELAVRRAQAAKRKRKSKNSRVRSHGSHASGHATVTRPVTHTPDPDPVKDFLEDDEVPRSGTSVARAEPEPEPSSMSIRGVLIRGYASRYEATGRGAWLQWDANRRSIDDVARWVRANAERSGEAPESLANRLLGAAFAKLGGRVPKWDFLAKDPGSYLEHAPPPPVDKPVQPPDPNELFMVRWKRDVAQWGLAEARRMWISDREIYENMMPSYTEAKQAWCKALFAFPLPDVEVGT